MWIRFAAATAIACASLWGQAENPVRWSLELEPQAVTSGGRAVGKLTASIEEGWHLYAVTNPTTPVALKLEMEDAPAIASVAAEQPEPDVQLDPLFDNKESHWYEGEAIFWIEIETATDAQLGPVPVNVKLRYSACNDRLCLPPARREASATLQISEVAAAIAAPEAPAGYQAVQIALVQPQIAAPDALVSAAASAKAPTAYENPADQGLFRFAAVAFGFGLLAIFTPCVFPMIPVMMSYFVSTQSGEKKASLVQASTFVVGVIGLFTAMGAAVSGILGPFGMQQIGGNVWVNALIAAVFFAFGASLLGAFEITVPSGLMTSLNQKAGTGGVLPTLMMGLVFALASFACTGPFVGALLAGSVSGGNLAWPVFGMLMFSAGLALPFFGLALFPSYLDKLPRAGGWMERVKIAMAFVILAAGVKYWSNVDQAFGWELLTRERFLATWVVLFTLGGLYLLGLLKLDHGGDEGPISLTRLGFGALFLVFAISLIPGMFGGRLGELDAYVPEAKAGAFLSGGAADKTAWLKDDYEGALAEAGRSGKRALLIFTGYYCTNCKWMKTNMFPRPEVAAAVDDLVVVELYTDDADEAISGKHQALLSEKFNTAAIPFYALVDADGNEIATFAGSTRDETAFLEFLRAT